MASLGQVKEERQIPFSSEDGERCLQVWKKQGNERRSSSITDQSVLTGASVLFYKLAVFVLSGSKMDAKVCLRCSPADAGVCCHVETNSRFNYG